MVFSGLCFRLMSMGVSQAFSSHTNPVWVVQAFLGAEWLIISAMAMVCLGLILRPLRTFSNSREGGGCDVEMEI